MPGFLLISILHDVSLWSVNTEQRKAQFRAYYHRNKESRRAYAAAHQVKVRAARRLTETPEQADERRRKIREWYAKNVKKRGVEPLPDLLAMAGRQRSGFLMILIGLLMERRCGALAKRREWQHRRYGSRDRKPKQIVVKIERVPKTPEEKRERAAAYAREWRARQPKRIKIQKPPKPAKIPKPARVPTDPQIVRARRRANSDRWLAKMKATDPLRYADYKKRQTEAQMNHRRTNPQRRFACALRTKVYVAIRRQQGGKKTANTVTLTGCTVLELMAHIEKQFEPGMTWEKFGRGDGRWSMDHIRPLASWDLTDPAQQREAFHWSNLAPRWSVDNLSKGSHWNGRRWLHTDHACVPAVPA